MAETRRYNLANQSDSEHIVMEAQHRWLRPAEICEILRNYKRFPISSKPADKPPSGSLFLFDRKELRYFRKDGHNWRKKKDGKTIKEAHERLKAGSVDVLHCYYAHGEEDESFQRRSYWMLEEELSHIVLVHYREVKGIRTNFKCIKDNGETLTHAQETDDVMQPKTEMGTSLSSGIHPNIYQVPSQAMDTTGTNSAQAPEYEEAESDDPGKLSGIPGVNNNSLSEVNKIKDIDNVGLMYEPPKHHGSPLLEDDIENNCGRQHVPFQPTFRGAQPDTMGIDNNLSHGIAIMGQLFTRSTAEQHESESLIQVARNWQASSRNSSHLSHWPIDNVHPSSDCEVTSWHCEREANCVDFQNSLEQGLAHPDKLNKHPVQSNSLEQLSNADHYSLKSDLEATTSLDGLDDNLLTSKQIMLDGSSAEGLKKLDSFNQWMSKELGDVEEPSKQSTSGAYWDTVESENEADRINISAGGHLETYHLDPSISHDQLFSIIDFSPSWTYEGSEIKVLISGRFLRSEQEAENCKWSCMFGEIEVPAEIIGNGVLRCHTPPHKAGRVPFYITCSNRLACSEVREFDFQVSHIREKNATEGKVDSFLENLRMRFGELLSLGPAICKKFDSIAVSEKSQLGSKICTLLEKHADQWDKMLKLTLDKDFSPENVQEQQLEMLLKEKLQAWLLQKLTEDGKGPHVLDEGGQGVLHFAAALGYNWALQPTIFAGVNVNFRDVNGWNALHWAAFCGRERTVASLISLGAAPGALTDPCPKYPSGRTPADLASAKGHKGIAGYLAESDLSAHLVSLNLNKEVGAGEISRATVVQRFEERNAIPMNDGEPSDGLSLKDSLAAVCNATLTAARIHQVFRVQSFQRKQLKEYGDDKLGMSEEQALSFIALKSNKAGLHDEPVQAAAVRIQNKFRSWKGRKEFLIIRQRIVKIQAHVRGHQVRKNYRKIVWSVGIVEKIILRWRRKGSGLRGFKPEAITEGSIVRDTSSKEDDYDFLREGRKQTEERMQKALARVKSMVQYPEARDQYHRLLNVVTEIQGTQVKCDRSLNNSEETIGFDDIEALLDEDTFMPTAT